MDVSLAMGDMLTEMQGCLTQLCGNSAAGNPKAVAQLIAEEMAAMNSSPGHNRVQDKCDDVLILPAPAEMARNKVQSIRDLCYLQRSHLRAFKDNGVSL
ncbi:hypothetical protein ABBQ38_006690 [Trebouxia sp. C0009 RCD-2024]